MQVADANAFRIQQTTRRLLLGQWSGPQGMLLSGLLTLAYLPTSKGCGAEYGSETLLDHEGECPDQKIALVHPQA